MFEKSLQDLVKGIRAIKGDPAAYIAKCIQEIKDELKSRDVLVKTQALQKLTYLNMLGHDMSWAAFHVIEVMSQERFALKRIGFWACAQSFTPATDVIVLCTQLLKKEFSARSAYEIGSAINCLANIATEDLSRDLLADVVTMLTSARPYIRKKATLVLYKLYLQYPQGLRLTFDNLKRKLTDDNPSVVSCAVNVVCELARKRPSNYLALAPDLFALLTSPANNWMLIKVAKLLSSLVQEEPRLARKLLEPLATIVQTTGAKSLMYECISTITFALQHTKRPDGTDAKNATAVVRLCTDKLREMVRDPDQNLKYLGLTGLMGLMRSNPRVVAEHRELVLACLTDDDVTIRLRALELVTGMVTRRNLPDIVKRFMELLETAEGNFRDVLMEKIVFICSRDKYAYLVDFAWYVQVLTKLAYVQGNKHHATVASQLLDVSVRVEEVRPYAVQALLPMLADSTLAMSARMPSAAAATSTVGTGDVAPPLPPAPDSEDAPSGSVLLPSYMGVGHVLFAAAWICGEYCSIIPVNMHAAVLDALLHPMVASLPPAVQGAYIQCALKLLNAAAAAAVRSDEAGASSPFIKLAATVLERLNPFAQAVHVEVQERACLAQQLLSSLGVPFTPLPTPASASAAKAKAEAELMELAGGAVAAPSTSPSKAPPPPLEADVKVIATVLSSLFSEPLKPINAKAQRKVAVPVGLDIDRWIVPGEEKAYSDAVPTAGGKPAFKHESISFEDSVGIEDEDYAGSDARGRIVTPVGSGADAEDDEWMESLARKNRKEAKDRWGDNSPRKKSTKDGAGAGAGARHNGGDDGGGGRKTGGRGGGKGDPFILRSSSRGAAGTADSAEIDVDSIPIAKVDGPALRASLDILGDFGRKPKKPKDPKKRRGGDDDDEEEPAGAARKGAFRVADDDEMPGGASDDDKPAGVGGRKGVSDALSNVDITTPLGDHETLHTYSHRTAGGKDDKAGAGGRGRGRARVLGGADAAAAAPAAAAPAAADADADGKKKKKKKAKDEEAGDADGGKKKKKGKGDAAAAAAAPASPAPAAAAATAAASPAPAAVAAAAAAALPQGEEYATSPAHVYALAADKVVKLAYAINAMPIVSAAAGGAGSSDAAALAGAVGVATITIKVDPKSSKKTVDYVDIALPPSVPVLRAGAAAGAGAGALRLAAGLKEKAKGKHRGQKATIRIAIANPAVTATVPVTITYLVTGASAPVTIEAALILRSAAILVPTQIDQAAYRALMTSSGDAFTHAAASFVKTPTMSNEEAIDLVCAVFRTYAVARSPQHAILYGQTVGGAHVTALLRLDEASSSATVTIKSVLPEHAAVLVRDITEVVQAEMKERAEKAADDE